MAAVPLARSALDRYSDIGKLGERRLCALQIGSDLGHKSLNLARFYQPNIRVPQDRLCLIHSGAWFTLRGRIVDAEFANALSNRKST